MWRHCFDALNFPFQHTLHSLTGTSLKQQRQLSKTAIHGPLIALAVMRIPDVLHLL